MNGLAPASRQRPLGRGGGRRTAHQRKFVDVGGTWMIVVFCKPVPQFRIARAVMRSHIFDVEDMPHQALVAELRGKLVGFLEVAAFGGREELAIGLAVHAVEDFRAPDA